MATCHVYKNYSLNYPTIRLVHGFILSPQKRQSLPIHYHYPLTIHSLSTQKTTTHLNVANLAIWNICKQRWSFLFLLLWLKSHQQSKLLLYTNNASTTWPCYLKSLSFYLNTPMIITKTNNRYNPIYYWIVNQ